MEYEWDEIKSLANRRRRGFGFEFISGMDWSIALLLEVQFVGGEERELFVGPISGGLYTVVTVEGDDFIRIVSLRRASRQEQALWRAEFQNG